jgi:hypothetical protein
MVFDTLMYAKKLKQVSFTEAQAEVQAEAIAELVHDKLTTKQDLKKLEITMKRDSKELEMRLIFKLTSIIVIVVGLFTSLLGVFIKLAQ